MIKINKLKHFSVFKEFRREYSSVVYSFNIPKNFFIFYALNENETTLVIGKKQLNSDGMKNSIKRQFEYNIKYQK